MQYNLKMLLLMFCLCLAACGTPEPRPIALPEDISEITDKFIAALHRGDIDAARAHISEDAQKDFTNVFTGPDANRPSKQLRPHILDTQPFGLGQHGLMQDAVVTYGHEKNGRWELLILKLYEQDEKYEIIDFSYKTNANTPPQILLQQKAAKFFPWALLGITLIAALVLALIIWLALRKPHILAPRSNRTERDSASTLSDREYRN